MAQLDVALKEAMEIPGAIGVAIVDHESGMVLGSASGTGQQLDLEVAGAGITEVVRAEMGMMRAVGLDDAIEDVLITLGTQYHLIRLITVPKGAGLFFYLALSKPQANLAMARRQLQAIEADLVL